MDGEDFSTSCFYKYPNGKYCLQSAGGDCCDQCGIPLCQMHQETGAGFCHEHPTADCTPFGEEEMGETGEIEAPAPEPNPPVDTDDEIPF